MRKGTERFCRGLYRLFRLPLALMNGTAAVGGYLLFPSAGSVLDAVGAFMGVTLLAMGASTLNQVQEREQDGRMRRTAGRPLPAGEMSPLGAALFGAAVIAAGSSTLAVCGGSTPLLIGLATLFIYLAVYTPLKRVTSLALLIGALCGCAPPLIGWSIAGGGPIDFRIVLLAGILYLWQVPHFWFLQRRLVEEYRAAGFPVFSPAAGSRALLLLWVTAMVLAALMLPAFGVITSSPLLWSLLFAAPLLLSPFSRLQPAVAAGVNLFPALVTLAISLR